MYLVDTYITTMLTMGQEQNEKVFHVHTSSIPHDVLMGSG
jgi:hypothetical protein